MTKTSPKAGITVNPSLKPLTLHQHRCHLYCSVACVESGSFPSFMCAHKLTWISKEWGGEVHQKNNIIATNMMMSSEFEKNNFCRDRYPQLCVCLQTRLLVCYQSWWKHQPWNLPTGSPFSAPVSLGKWPLEREAFHSFGSWLCGALFFSQCITQTACYKLARVYYL